MKMIAGSILVGFSLLAQVLSGLSGGSDWLALREEQWSVAVHLPLGLEILVWLFMAIGMILLAWGLWETRPKPVPRESSAEVRTQAVGWKRLWHDPVARVAIIVIWVGIVAGLITFIVLTVTS